MRKIFIVIGFLLIVIIAFVGCEKKNQSKSISQLDPLFKESEYNSSDGMMTAIWGPAMWHAMHTISFNYPIEPSEEEKQEYKDFFLSLRHVLPCRYCRDNYTQNLELLPLTDEVLKNRNNFSRWVYDLHQLVNVRLGKTVNITYEEVKFTYEHFRSRCLENEEENGNEKGCTTPYYGKKSKCVINIVPNDTQIPTFNMDPECLLKKIT